MTTIRQLNPPLPMITPLGYAQAYFIWGEDRLVWYGVFQQETGEQWWWLNNYVRMVISISDEQFKISPIVLPPEMEVKLSSHRKRYKNWKEW